MAQEESVTDKIKEKYKFVDIVFGTHNINNLPTLLYNKIAENKNQIEVLKEGTRAENMPVKRDSKYKAWVNIMEGCDKFCTYCIVPYTRGRQKSRLKEDIIKEVENLIKDGYQEITLLGQNVNAYGKDLKNGFNFANLLEEVAQTGINRIRFVTSHPWDFTDEMIDIIAKYDNIMPYIHLPLQSGSDRILKLMGRRYKKEEYMILVNKIKEKVKNASLTTDIIVGFPGESSDDFKDTLDIVNTCKFDSAFTFIFSPRVGTPASKFKDDVTLEEKEKRLQTLNELVNNYSALANQKYLNQKVKVLIEGISEKDENCLFGYTETNKLVNVKGDKEMIGKIVNVLINKVQTWSMDGEIIEDRKSVV
jgi:tRNA-2-methylthio-N6-dimethylallyladenosine synthase